MNPSIRAKGLTKVHTSSATELLANITLRRAILSRGISNPLTGAKVKAVDSLNLTVNPGERLGIIGRNGAGKSTLLSLLAGLSEPTGGSLEIEGHVTAVMTLGVGLREDLSGRENIYIDGEIQGKTRAGVDAVINDIIEFADIGEFIDYPLRTYSTGMKARLAFSMIINIDPEILIIDETLSVGDASFAIKATSKIREICDRGKIVIIVAHRMESIVEMCNRCLWLDKGHIMMDGSPAEVTAAYVNTVRREDEIVFLQKFRRHQGCDKFRDGCAIHKLELYRPDDGTIGAIFVSGNPLAIRIGAVLDVARAAEIEIRIVRMDGLTVCVSRWWNNAQLSELASLNCEALFEPLVLGAGIYLLTVDLCEKHIRLAQRSTIFEVQVNSPPVGGKPALIYPCSLDAAPLP